MLPGINRSDLCRLLVDTDEDLTPDASLGAAVLRCVPFAFTLDLDAGAVDQQVQRTLRATIWNVYRKRPLTASDCAEVRHVPVKPRRPKQAFYKARRLTSGHPEQHFHRQTTLDGSVTECPEPVPVPVMGRFGISILLGIEPDLQ